MPETRTYTYSNATIRVRVPDLTKEERKKRMQILRNAAAKILK